MSHILSKDRVVLIQSVEVAHTFLRRFAGLMLRKPLPPGHAMLITPCHSIHTCFMRFSLDVFFLDHGNRVVKICRRVRPFRLASGGRQARSVLEMTSDWLAPDALHTGDIVELRDSKD